jgi:hypothetical protein
MTTSKSVFALVLLMSATMVNVSSGRASDDWKARCAAVDDNRARLACYDAANPPQHPARAAILPPVPANKDDVDHRAWYDPGRIFGTSPAVGTRPEQFGADSIKRPANAADANAAPQAKPIDHITARVSDYTIDGYGRFVVVLDNGQVWKQSPGDGGHARFRKNRPNTVAISRGLLGYYGLVLNDDVASFTVVRIK